MNRDPELERLRNALERATKQAVPSKLCPSPERLWESAAGELQPDEHRAVLSHAAICGSCANDWDLAVRAQEARGVGTERLSERSWRWAAWAPAAGLAATVLLAVGILQISPSRPEPGISRDAPSASIVSLLPAGEPLSRSQPVLRWSYPGEDLLFAVKASWLAADGPIELAAVERLARPEYRLPAEGLSEVPEGAKVYWEVTVQRHGSTLARQSFSTELR